QFDLRGRFLLLGVGQRKIAPGLEVRRLFEVEEHFDGRFIRRPHRTSKDRRENNETEKAPHGSTSPKWTGPNSSAVGLDLRVAVAWRVCYPGGATESRMAEWCRGRPRRSPHANRPIRAIRP